MASLYSVPKSAFDAYIPLKLLNATGEDGPVFFAVARNPPDDAHKPLVALKVLNDEARKAFKKRQSHLLAALKDMQDGDEQSQHPVVQVLDWAEDYSWHTMRIIVGSTVRDVRDELYPNGLPPSLLLHITQKLVRAQAYLKARADPLCHRDLKAGRNVMLSFAPNQLPKVTLIDFNGIHRWNESKAIEHIVYLAKSSMGDRKKRLVDLKIDKEFDRTVEEMKLFYETLETYQCRENRSTFAELVSFIERLPPSLTAALRNDKDEQVLNAILQQPAITQDEVDKALAEGGMEVTIA